MNKRTFIGFGTLRPWKGTQRIFDETALQAWAENHPPAAPGPDAIQPSEAIQLLQNLPELA